MINTEENEILISVIMPVYNSNKYLADAVNSITKQNFEGFELILIDDGSKDNSAQICEKLAAEDCRIRFVRKENGGTASARNEGLRLARGRYIAFCDNDDEYCPNLFKDNYELAVKNDADLVRYGYESLELNDKKIISSTVITYPNQIITKEEFADNYFKIRRVNAIWCGLYKKSVIDTNDLRFDEKIRSGGDDLGFNLRFIAYSNKIVLNEKVYYRWYKRITQSTSFKLPKSLLVDETALLNLEYEMLHEYYDEADNLEKTKYLLRRYIMYLIRSKKMAGYSFEEMINVFEEERKLPVFCGFIDKCCHKQLWKECKSYYIFGILFHFHKYRILYFMYYMFHIIFENNQLR